MVLENDFDIGGLLQLLLIFVYSLLSLFRQSYLGFPSSSWPRNPPQSSSITIVPDTIELKH